MRTAIKLSCREHVEQAVIVMVIGIYPYPYMLHYCYWMLDFNLYSTISPFWATSCFETRPMNDSQRTLSTASPNIPYIHKYISAVTEAKFQSYSHYNQPYSNRPKWPWCSASTHASQIAFHFALGPVRLEVLEVQSILKQGYWITIKWPSSV